MFVCGISVCGTCMYGIFVGGCVLYVVCVPYAYVICGICVCVICMCGLCLVCVWCMYVVCMCGACVWVGSMRMYLCVCACIHVCSYGRMCIACMYFAGALYSMRMYIMLTPRHALAYL